MVTLALVGAAYAAPVQCDALEAARLLAEARIEERRAPVTHPELIPGLALASARTDIDLRTALTDLCDAGAISLVAGERWEGTGWSAHTFLLTRTQQAGCTLFRQTIAISVGVAENTAPRYALRARLPTTRTPVGDCPTLPTWREEEMLAGQGGPVRLVLAQDIEGGSRTHSEVLVRRAGPEGWTEQVLMEPAPARLVDGGEGPRFDLTERFEDKWVVAHHDRVGTGDDCKPVAGQTVWTWDPEDAKWTAHSQREALGLLASRGLWRLAGEDGWMLILAQADEEDRDKIDWRMRRYERKSPEPLDVLPSAWFPGLNPGFLIVAPAPWSTRDEADDARSRAPKWRRAYVKRAWTMADPCEDQSQAP